MKSTLMGSCAVGIFSLAATDAFAQSSQTTGAVSEVIVTGTRTQGLRAVDSAAPVQVIGHDVLTRVGQPDLVQALAQTLPSVQAQAYGGDTGEFNMTFNLRGLSPNETLVLVDGKRRHGTANLEVTPGPYNGADSADLSYIPVAAIDHIEVLQDGAAAQYGTDAIAGVINIITKKNHSGGSLQTSAGQYMDGGGLTEDITGSIGLSPNEKSFLDLAFESKWHDHSFRGDVDERVINTGTPANTAANLLARFPLIASAPDYPYVNRWLGDARVQQDTITYNGGYDIAPNVQLYSFGSVGYKDGRAFEIYRTPTAIVGPTGNHPFPAGFSPQENIRETDFAFTVGAKGNQDGTTWDLSSTFGSNYDRVHVLNSSNASLYAATGASPTNFHNGDFVATQWDNTLDLTHAFDVGMAKPMVLAGGAEYRVDAYELKAGDPASYYGTGSQSYAGYSPANAGSHRRSNYSIYLDDALTPVLNWKIDAALRYENYTDFGSTTVGELTSRYDFNDAVAIRGTVSSGFRAPTLAEEYYSGIFSGPATVSGLFAPNSPGAAALGISGLKPEESVNYSVGLVTHLAPRLTMTLDAYAIRITNRIVQSGTFYGYNGNPAVPTSPSVLTALTANGVTISPNVFTPGGSVGIQTFVNGADTQTYGVDYLATYAMDYGGWGHVDYSLSANYNSTSVTRVLAPPKNVAQNVLLLDRTAVSNLVDATPKWRATIGAYWSLGRWSLNARESLYGSSFTYAQDILLPQYDQLKVDAAAITDLELGVKIIPSVKLSFGANNLFNTYPTKNPLVYRQGFFQVNISPYAGELYSQTSPYGINGGYYYGRLTWTF